MNDELLASTLRAAGKSRTSGTKSRSLNYGVHDIRVTPGRLDIQIVQRDGHSARLELSLPSSGEPPFWIYAPAADAEDWVQQLLVSIDEEVSTRGLASGRARVERDGKSYVQATPYGWRMSDPDEHERLLTAAGHRGWNG
jgi:hypothetical protein